jgi:phage terminase small subunit
MTAKQTRFVAEYLVDTNATQAATRAGYSPKTAGNIGHELLKKPEIATAISKRQVELLAEVGLTPARIRQELAEIALADLTSFYNADGSLKALEDLEPGQGKLLASLETVVKNVAAGDGHVDTVLKVKLHDRLKALEILARYSMTLPAAKVDVTLTVVYEEKRRQLELGRANAAAKAIEGQVVEEQVA